MLTTRRLAGALLALAAACSAAPAAAEPGAPERPSAAPPAPATRTEWYGWKTLLLVGAADLTTALTYDSDTPLPLASVPLRVLGPPAIHAAHGAWERGGLSLGLNLGLPAVGFLVAVPLAANLSDCDPLKEVCRRDQRRAATLAGVSGMAIGGAIATAIDVSLLSYRSVPARERRIEQGKVRVVPAPVVGRGLGGLGVVGQF